MRRIDRSTAFKRDYRRKAKGRRQATLDEDLVLVLEALATDRPLEPRYRDHNLIGMWSSYRECHVRPDLLLIYRKPDMETLQLVRLGSHSELFG